MECSGQLHEGNRLGMSAKKTIAVLLLFTQSLILSACSSGAQPINQKGRNIATPKEYTIEDSSVRYSSNSVKIPNADIKFEHMVKSREGAFLCGRDEDGNTCFFVYNTVAGEMSQLYSLGEQTAEAIAASPNGALHALRIEENGQYYISSVSPEGTVSQLPLDLKKYADDMIYDFYATDTGFIIELGRHVIAVNAEGTPVQDYGERFGSVWVAAFPDKTFLAQIVSQDSAFVSGKDPGAVITELNADLSMGQSYRVETQFTKFFPGADGQLLGIMNRSVYSYDPENGHSTALINALASNMNTESIVCLSDGLYLTLHDGFPYLWQPSTGDSTTVLTLATYQLSFDMQRAIEAFNSSGSSYVINPIDYASYDAYSSASSGMTRFAADIISGTAPDIYDMSFLSPNNLAAKGLLEDIRPFFDKDSAVSYDDLLSCVSKNVEFMGGLYELIPAFSIVTVCGDISVTGEAWGIEDFVSLAETCRSEAFFGADYTKSDFLSDILCFMKEDLYSEENLTCNFTSDSFVSMLEFAKNLPSNFDYDGNQGEPMGRAYAGEQLLVMTNLGFSAVDEISLLNGIFGGEAQFVGFPSDSSNGVGIRPCVRLGMASASANKEGVWEFFKFLMGDSVQLNAGMFGGLPSVSSCYEKAQSQKISRAIEKQPEAYGVSLTGPVHFFGAEVDSAAMIKTMDRLVDEADCIMSCDKSILDIVLACAEPFFAGDKTAREVANEIQSKVNIYLSEQYG